MARFAYRLVHPYGGFTRQVRLSFRPTVLRLAPFRIRPSASFLRQPSVLSLDVGTCHGGYSGPPLLMMGFAMSSHGRCYGFVGYAGVADCARFAAILVMGGAVVGAVIRSGGLVSHPNYASTENTCQDPNFIGMAATPRRRPGRGQSLPTRVRERARGGPLPSARTLKQCTR